jgi:hypothetical protein
MVALNCVQSLQVPRAFPAESRKDGWFAGLRASAARLIALFQEFFSGELVSSGKESRAATRSQRSPTGTP